MRMFKAIECNYRTGDYIKGLTDSQGNTSLSIEVTTKLRTVMIDPTEVIKAIEMVMINGTREELKCKAVHGYKVVVRPQRGRESSIRIELHTNSDMDTVVLHQDRAKALIVELVNARGFAEEMAVKQ
ncbi:hypothetical protein [Bacillus sp. SN10]|uniref:hypothetical protein n=1 Tax=Bacillus sp. SN10 TaxID=2056493 RepID=UPI000C31D3CF|nr:hypothetical protein [Bacillus sp. SN10]PKJ52643.1 hypothetical protein CWE34_26335 [Bacillus sp. SN10]